MNDVTNARPAGGDPAREMWSTRVARYARDGAPQTRRFAAALLDLTAPRDGETVLDIATGTGVVAVAAAQRVGPAGRVVATDFIAEWAPYVQATAAEAGVDNVTFEVMSAEALALPDAAFDVVLCQFGLMFVPDKLLALREMRRVLRPGGRLGLTVWSVPERVGIFLISGIVGAALPPEPGPPPLSPLSLGAPGLVEGLVAEAGFRDVRMQPHTLGVEIASAETEWERWAGDTDNPMVARFAALPEAERAALRARVISEMEARREGEVIVLTSEALLVTAAC
ncbi:MAG: class I SAM-dependent methyltransferase [Thermomicrobiales bacterium]